MEIAMFRLSRGFKFTAWRETETNERGVFQFGGSLEDHQKSFYLKLHILQMAGSSISREINIMWWISACLHVNGWEDHC